MPPGAARALVAGTAFAGLLLAGVWPTASVRAQGARVAAALPVAHGSEEHPASVAELLAAGDREFAARRAAAALTLYEAALAIAPDRYDVLWRTARTLVDVGEGDTNEKRRRGTFERANALATRAVAAKPNDVEGHFHRSRALGRVALSVSPRDRTRYALEIRSEALRALALEPAHAGAQHVLGRWHAEIMRLNGFMRAVAKTFMGGKVFDEASWAEAVRLLEGAAAAEPDRTVHLLALGQVYRDAGDRVAARRNLEAALRAPLTDPNDELYKREAERDLKALR